jgi:hypothetical protein
VIELILEAFNKNKFLKFQINGNNIKNKKIMKNKNKEIFNNLSKNQFYNMKHIMIQKIL